MGEVFGVVGAGTMGNGIAQVAARAGFDVVIRDVAQDFLARGMAAIDKSLQRDVDKERLAADEKQSIVRRIKTTTEIADLRDAAIVVEAVTEDFTVKAEVFKGLDESDASRESIDGIMKLGMNHPMGPLTLADFIGLDVCLAIINVLHDGFSDSKYRPCPLLKRYVDAGWLGRKSGRGFYEY